MTLCLVLSLSPLPPPALSCLLASISPPPAGSWEEQAAMMIAWRVSSPACLPVVDFPMPPHRCRLVGRGGERAIFVPGSVLAGGSVLVSSCRLVMRGSCPRRIASMTCPRVFYLLAIMPRLVPSSRRPVSSGISGGGVLSCAACLMGSRWCSHIALSPRRAGRGAKRDTMRFRNRFHDVFMNW